MHYYSKRNLSLPCLRVTTKCGLCQEKVYLILKLCIQSDHKNNSNHYNLKLGWDFDGLSAAAASGARRNGIEEVGE